MLEIIFTVFLVTFMFSLLFIGVGVLGRKNIFRAIKDTVRKEAPGVRVVESPVNTAAMDVRNKVMHVNTKHISEEIIDTTKAVYEAAKSNYEYLKEFGLENVRTYGELHSKIADSIYRSIVNHEAGHIDDPSEAGAEAYSAMKDYGKNPKELNLDYLCSFFNLIKKGGREGYNTVRKVSEELKYGYGIAIDTINEFKKAMLDSDVKTYKNKKHFSADF